VPNAFRVALAVFGLIILLSVVLFHLTLGLSWVDAIYFVSTTITTVGYGDINLQQAAPWQKLYGSFLMLCSAGLLATICSIITNLLLQTRLRDVLSRGCSDQRGHLVIVGLGNVGYRLVSSLIASGEKVVAVENNRDGRFVEAVKRLTPVVHGDARIPSTLELAGLAGAKALVVVTSRDIENIAIGLASKRTAPLGRVILRLFDAKLADSMGKGPQIDALLSVSTIAAPHLVAAGLRRDALKGLLVDDLLIVLFATPGEGDAPHGIGIEMHPLRPVSPPPP
jgi:voltage-gated potassium channel Kch